MKRLFTGHVNASHRGGLVRLENVITRLTGQRLTVLLFGVIEHLKRYFIKRRALVASLIVLAIVAHAKVFFYFMVSPHRANLFPANIHFFSIKPKQ